MKLGTHSTTYYNLDAIRSSELSSITSYLCVFDNEIV